MNTHAPRSAARSLTLVAALALCVGLFSAPAMSMGSMASPLARMQARGEIPATLDRSETLGGVDADHNGSRDDIDAYLAKVLKTPKALAAGEQKSRALRLAVEAGGDRAKAQAASAAVMRATQCLWSVLGESQPNPEQISTGLSALIANTPARALSYEAFNQAISGSSMQLPGGDSCER